MDQRRNKSLGDWGETQACWFLERHGFSICDRNFHTTQGEIDVVAAKAGDHYFIEVKTRYRGDLATDLAVTPAQRYKLKKTIKTYCYRRSLATGSLIMASLLVIIDRPARQLSFRLAVIY